MPERGGCGQDQESKSSSCADDDLEKTGMTMADVIAAQMEAELLKEDAVGWPRQRSSNTCSAETWMQTQITAFVLGLICSKTAIQQKFRRKEAEYLETEMILKNTLKLEV